MGYALNSAAAMARLMSAAQTTGSFDTPESKAAEKEMKFAMYQQKLSGQGTVTGDFSEFENQTSATLGGGYQPSTRGNSAAAESSRQQAAAGGSSGGTMLTGSAGVDSSAMQVGKKTLIGR